ncbi:MAG: alpha-glucan family phosphorylase [Pseudomonadota bacterium]
MTVRRYVVIPPMEGGLEELREIAGNLWYSWNMEAVELFDHLDEQVWQDTNHNPLQTLVRLSRQRLDEIRSDEGYQEHAARVRHKFASYVKRTRPYDFGLEHPVDFTTAYFSLEFGLTESLPIYSGGLGLLAGDHLKSASDLSLPLVGIGLMYQEGYFRQRLSREGWQQEYYPRTEFDTLPVERQTDPEGATLLVEVDLAGERLLFRILKVNVGRVALYLLDADIPENPPHLRATTARLYGGDEEMRIRQEILLGMGGCRALNAMGIRPSVYHLNEGHAAFALLERVRHYVEDEKLSLEEARQMAASESVLTIHTPVPAGNDVFERGLMEKYFGRFISKMGVDFETFLSLGRKHPEDRLEGFCMTVLGLRLSCGTNGVSRLHGKVARDMWHEVWRTADNEDVPIGSITNGVHIPSYISRDLNRLYDRYLEPGWTEDPDSSKIWQRAAKIPDTELWRNHERCRGRLVYFARRRLVNQLEARGASNREIDAAKEVLDPEALTICFGRRFATYKRANLLFRDPETLARIVSSSERPLQLIFAGKAHPRDNNGKEIIRQILQSIRQEPFRNRIVFIEDYDINVARYMVQGADVWLNTPRRPLEACGTSGMKAAGNGALNLSVLDGWWDEAYEGDNGWAIGWREEYDNPEHQDEIESRALYDILEESVKPLFYDRGVDEMPRNWIRMMKRSIQTICPQFNSLRMVSDYVQSAYVPSAHNSSDLRRDDYAGLRRMVRWQKSIREDWDKISVRAVMVRNEEQAVKGRDIEVVVAMDTAGHAPGEFSVELLHGPLDLKDDFKVRYVTPLKPSLRPPDADGDVEFSGRIPLAHSGLYGYGVRVTPYHGNLPLSQVFDLVHRG